MFKMSNPFIFNIYKKKDPFSRSSSPVYLVKVKEFNDGGETMVLCIQLIQISTWFRLTLRNIERNNFANDWTILSDLYGTPGLNLLQQIFSNLNFALAGIGKTLDSLTMDDLGAIMQTATEKYRSYLNDPPNGKPGLYLVDQVVDQEYEVNLRL